MKFHKLLFNKIVSNKSDIYDLIFQYLIKFVNYIVPFLIIPYIISTIGVMGYGKFIFCFSLISYFNVLVEFGFDITLTKQILFYKDFKSSLSNLFSFTLFFRFILLILSTFIYIIIINLINIPGDKTLYTFTYIYIFSGLLNFNSFFYAFNNVKTIAIINSIVKIIYLIAIYLLVKTESDLNKFAILNILSYILPSIILFIYVIKKYELKLLLNNILSRRNKIIYLEARNSFLSNLSVSLYGTTNTFMLGLLGTPSSVVLFDSLEKIFNGFTSIISSANFVIYPKLVRGYYNKLKFKILLKKIEKIYFSIIILGVIVLFVFKNKILDFLNVSKIENSDTYILIFLLALIFSPFGSFFTRVFLVLGKTKDLLKITFVGFIINTATITIIFYNDLISIFPVTILITQIYIAVTKKLRILTYLKKI